MASVNVGIKGLMLMKIYTGIQQLKLDSDILEIVVQALWAKGASQ